MTPTAVQHERRRRWRPEGRNRDVRDLMRTLGWACAVLVAVDATTATVPATASRAAVLILSGVAILAWLVSLTSRVLDTRLIGAVLAVTGLAGAGVQWLMPSGPGVLLAFMAMAGAGLRLGRRAAALVGAPVIVAVGIAEAHTSSHPLSAALSLAAGAGFLLLASAFAGLSRDASRRAEALLQQEAQTRAAREEAAVLGERARLARELHDVLAHSLAGLNVQLEGARLLAASVDADPRLIEQIALAQRLARDGMLGAKRAVSTLRGESLPGPADLPALVEEARVAGHPTTMDVVGEAHPLPAELGLAVYRTVQEAITNATKYAGASAPIAVVLTWSPLALSVEVRNGAGDKRAPALPSGGYGLAGLAERARLAGGRFDSGPDGDGWRVQLTLPLAVGAPAAVSA